LLEVTDGRVLATLDDLAKRPEGQLDSRCAAVMREALIRRQEAAADENEAPLDEENAKRLTLDRAMRGLRDPDPLIRDRAIGRLRRLEGPEAVVALVSALDDPVVKVRSSAALALGAASALEALPALVEHMLSDESSHVRLTCAAFMDRFPDRRAVEALLQVLTDSDLRLVKSAIRGLGNLGDPRAILSLLPMLDHPERSVRFFTASALLKLKAVDQRLVAALEKLTQDPEAEEHDLDADEWNCYLEKHRELYREEGEPEPVRRLKMRELVEQARNLLARTES
jgi:HEAT repeat protein